MKYHIYNPKKKNIVEVEKSTKASLQKKSILFSVINIASINPSSSLIIWSLKERH